MEARKKDGSFYSMGSLKTLRFGLNRHFKAVRGVDTMNEEEFSAANKVFAAKCVQLKKDGHANVHHKPPIADADLKKLYESGVFSTDLPNTLLNKVFFEIMLCFCHRGRQNLLRLRKSDFVVKTDSTGAKCVSKVVDELITKNHREDDEAEEGGIMCAVGGPFCPVASFEKYLQHLIPENELLSQRPKEEVTADSDVWYDNMVVGERTLGQMMKQMSKQAKLSVNYTNHSIRATAATILDKSGFEARHIMSVSGHRSESSIRSYGKTDESTKKRMSETLTAAAVSDVSAVSSRNQLAERQCVNLSPILSLSQGEHRDVHLSAHSQVSKQDTVTLFLTDFL